MVWTAALLVIVISYVNSGEGPAGVSEDKEYIHNNAIPKFKLIKQKKKHYACQYFCYFYIPEDYCYGEPHCGK